MVLFAVYWKSNIIFLNCSADQHLFLFGFFAMKIYKGCFGSS